jgi:hypothetical protein
MPGCFAFYAIGASGWAISSAANCAAICEGERHRFFVSAGIDLRHSLNDNYSMTFQFP